MDSPVMYNFGRSSASRLLQLNPRGDASTEERRTVARPRRNRIEMKTYSKVLTAMALVLVLSLGAFADTIKLKDGSIIKGRIISFSDGRFTIVIGDGGRQRQMHFFTDEVESVEFDGVGPSLARGSAPNYNDASPRIPAGNTTATNRPVATPTPMPTPAPTPTPVRTLQPGGGSSAARPIVVNAKVLADDTNNGWTNTGFVVRQGQTVNITATGRVTLGMGRTSTPAGSNIPDPGKLMANDPTGGLIAVIGDDNNDFIFIGERRQIRVTRDGTLYLGVNEAELKDNTGAFDVTIEIVQ